MANAKLDYLLALRKVDAFIAKNGETDEIIHYEAKVDKEYSDRVGKIYAEDKQLNFNKGEK